MNGQSIAFRNPRRDSSRERNRRYLRLAEYLCLLIAALFLGRSALGYVRLRAVQLYDTWEFDHGFATVTPERAGSSQLRSPARRARLEEGQLVGKLEIPRIGVSAMVLQGDDDDTLDDGAGHVPSSALPGEMRNVAVAAHRDTLFRGLRNVRVGDDITFATASGVYRYQVESMAKVSPKDVEVLRASAQPTLTLITCYPFNFVGHAPLRFVVKAVEIDAPLKPSPQDQELIADARQFAGEPGDSRARTIEPGGVIPSLAARDFVSHPTPSTPSIFDVTSSVTSAPDHDARATVPVAKLDAVAAPEPLPHHVSHVAARSADKAQLSPSSHEDSSAANDDSVDAASPHSHKKLSRFRSWLGAIPGHFKKERVETPASE